MAWSSWSIRTVHHFITPSTTQTIQTSHRAEPVFCAVTRTLGDLSDVPNRQPLRVAIGVAAPALEAWLRFSTDRTCTERAWAVRQQDRASAPQEIRRLKEQLYGTSRVTDKHIREQGLPLAERLVQDLNALERAFPNGFGSFAAELRSWAK